MGCILAFITSFCCSVVMKFSRCAELNKLESSKTFVCYRICYGEPVIPIEWVKNGISIVDATQETCRKCIAESCRRILVDLISLESH